MLADLAREQLARRLWKAVEALPNTAPYTTVATSILCAADVPPDGWLALLQVTNRLSRQLPQLPGPKTCKQSCRPSQTYISSLPAWVLVATQTGSGVVCPGGSIPAPLAATPALVLRRTCDPLGVLPCTMAPATGTAGAASRGTRAVGSSDPSFPLPVGGRANHARPKWACWRPST